jgi:hypothetical protein
MRLLLAAALLIASPILQALELTPYTASYHFNLDNKLSGTATRILEHTGGSNWRYVFTATTSMATATETSYFRFDGKTVTPSRYQRKHKVLFISKQAEVGFDWKTKQANTRRDDKKGLYALKNGAVDPLNFEVQLRRDMADLGHLAKTYLIADPKRLREQRFVIDGNETIDTPYGKVNTVRIKRIHEDPERHTTFWLARDMGFIPAKVIQDDDGAVYILQLSALTGALAKAETPKPTTP